MIAILIAAAAAATATPAALPVVATPPAAPARGDSRYVVRYDGRTNRYCIRDRNGVPDTGTHIIAIECRTVADWADNGLTITRR